MTLTSLLKKRSSKTLFLFFLLGIILISLLVEEKRMDKNAMNLEISHSLKFPLEEISGLHINQKKIYVIGDKNSHLGLATISKEDKIEEPTLIDFSSSLLNKFALCTSKFIPQCHHIKKLLTTQWEAIFVDNESRAFLLNEKLASIIVYHLKKNEVLSVINFEKFSSKMRKTPNARKSTFDNALGEGFVLLNNGHILVIKEKNKPSIIEFGESTETAQGYNQNLFLGNSTYKIKSKKISMIPLKTWYLSNKKSHCDLSEMTTDKMGQLYLLSQKCRLISMVSKLIINEDHVSYKKEWQLPSHIRSAEALAVLEKETKFIVGIDEKKSHKDNLFFLNTRL